MRPRAYALILLGTLLVGCMVYLLGQLVLHRSGEMMSVDELVERQRETNGLYFGFTVPTGNYKLAAYALRKPEIVILGSSRAHRQHQAYYLRPSYSMSGLVVIPRQALQILDLLTPIHKPKFVVYSLDFFALCRRSPFRGDVSRIARPKGAPGGTGWESLSQFSVVPRLIVRNVLSLQDAADFALGRIAESREGVRLYGLVAMKERLGFGLDGTVYEVKGRMQDAATFESSAREVVEGTLHYQSGCHYDPEAVAHLLILQNEMDRQGVRLIVLLPPMAPSVYRAFMAARPDISGYFKTWQAERARLNLPDLHDLSDGAEIGATDVEFSDATHGGDVSEARMLLKASETPGSALSEIVNRSVLQRLIRERGGWMSVELSYYLRVLNTRN